MLARVHGRKDERKQIGYQWAMAENIKEKAVTSR